ncbi:MAG: 6-phosphogluconolactonase, partial [Candidatus Rokubacteria bacterium]|nr:6-phosphogluconolactonase [Candidatus Rokubacteria bacterium]
LAVAVFVERLGARRLTLTLPVLNEAAAILFLVAGGDKAETLRAVLEAVPDAEPLPAQLVGPPAGMVTWLVDAAAASLLGGEAGGAP